MFVKGVYTSMTEVIKLTFFQVPKLLDSFIQLAFVKCARRLLKAIKQVQTLINLHTGPIVSVSANTTRLFPTAVPSCSMFLGEDRKEHSVASSFYCGLMTWCLRKTQILQKCKMKNSIRFHYKNKFLTLSSWRKCERKYMP